MLCWLRKVWSTKWCLGAYNDVHEYVYGFYVCLHDHKVQRKVFFRCIIIAVTWSSQVPMSFFHMHVHHSASLFIQSFGSSLSERGGGQLDMACGCCVAFHLQKAFQIVCTNFCPLLLSLLAENLTIETRKPEQKRLNILTYMINKNSTCLLENMVGWGPRKDAKYCYKPRVHQSKSKAPPDKVIQRASPS